MTLQLWPNWLDANCSISIGTSSGGNCSCSSHTVFALKVDWNWLAVAGSLGFQFLMRGENLRFSYRGCNRRSHTLPRDAVWRISRWGRLSRSWLHCLNSCDGVCSLAELSRHRSCMWSGVCLSSVADVETIGYGEFQNSPTFYVTGTVDRSANVSDPFTNWDKYLSGWDLDNSVLKLVVETFLFGSTWYAYTERKVKTALPMISLRRKILSKMRWTSITLSAQFSAYSMSACVQKNFNL